MRGVWVCANTEVTEFGLDCAGGGGNVISAGALREDS